MALSINDIQHNAFSAIMLCRDYFKVMLSVIMLNVVMLSVMAPLGLILD